jgi:hypothetical protein
MNNKIVGTSIRVNPGETLQKLMSDFGPDGNNIIASNKDTIDGMYMLDIEDI